MQYVHKPYFHLLYKFTPKKGTTTKIYRNTNMYTHFFVQCVLKGKINCFTTKNNIHLSIHFIAPAGKGQGFNIFRQTIKIYLFNTVSRRLALLCFLSVWVPLFHLCFHLRRKNYMYAKVHCLLVYFVVVDFCFSEFPFVINTTCNVEQKWREKGKRELLLWYGTSTYIRICGSAV